ncbi:hypothetical protein SRHO_G00270880 [Serrasalmus rhombeus]
MTSSTVFSKLKRHFSVHGMPHSDNARQYTSQHFKDFAKQWDFVHSTSSPEFPQSNGLVERAVRSAKQLMEKSQQGSPIERLISRQTCIPVCTKLLEPAPKITQQVSAQLLNKRLTLKNQYDKSRHQLQPLAEGQVVHIQTPKGYDQLGTVKGMSKELRSYIIQSNGKT